MSVSTALRLLTGSRWSLILVRGQRHNEVCAGGHVLQDRLSIPPLARPDPHGRLERLSYESQHFIVYNFRDHMFRLRKMGSARCSCFDTSARAVNPVRSARSKPRSLAGQGFRQETEAVRRSWLAAFRWLRMIT